MESEMKSNMSEMWRSKMPKGLDLEVSHHPLTMKSVVNLIIAAERLKGSRSESLLSTEFRDENLLSIMLDSIVEEQTVFECYAAPSAQYLKTGELLCSVTDNEKRNLVRVPNSMELHAVTLQGGAETCKVNLNMSTYVHHATATEAQAVALGIKDTNFYLSCHMDGDEPTLHLETVEDKESLKNISSESDNVRFLFYKHVTGVNVSTLVSVPFSNWYISTAVEDNRPVEMCLETAQRHRNFTIQALKEKKKSRCEGQA